MVTSPHVGFLYERAQDFSLYKGENWISAEADGIVVGALQDVLGDSSGGTTTASTTTSTTTWTSSSSSTTCTSANPRGKCRR